MNFSKPFLCFLFMFEKRYQICHMPVPHAVYYMSPFAGLFWSTYFSSIPSTNFIFCPHFPHFQQFFFSDFYGDNPFFNISSSSHLQICNGASLIDLEYILKCCYPPQKRNVQLAAKVQQYYFLFSIYPYTSIKTIFSGRFFSRDRENRD